MGGVTCLNATTMRHETLVKTPIPAGQSGYIVPPIENLIHWGSRLQQEVSDGYHAALGV